jgi:hypothetical protein
MNRFATKWMCRKGIKNGHVYSGRARLLWKQTNGQ